MDQKKDVERSIDDLMDSQERLRQKSFPLDTKIGNFTAAAWACIILGFFIAISPLFSSTTLGYGGYGDFFGGPVAGLWSLGGIFFIYVAFLGQQQQLINQQIDLIQNQIEMRDTRAELKGQKIELEKQNDHFKVQRFETTFFHLLSNFNKIANEIDFHEEKKVQISEYKVSTPTARIYGIRNRSDTVPDSTKLTDTVTINIFKGKDALVKIAEDLRNRFEIALNAKEEGDEEAKMKEAFKEFLYMNKGDLFHYVHNFFAILIFVDSSDIDNKSFYSKLLEVQVSPDEWNLIYYLALFRVDVDTQYIDLCCKYLDFANTKKLLFYSDKVKWPC